MRLEGIKESIREILLNLKTVEREIAVIQSHRDRLDKVEVSVKEISEKLAVVERGLQHDLGEPGSVQHRITRIETQVEWLNREEAELRTDIKRMAAIYGIIGGAMATIPPMVFVLMRVYGN